MPLFDTPPPRRMAEAEWTPELVERAQAAYERGNTHFDEGDFEAAIAAYGEAIDLVPEFVEALDNRAVAYMRLRRFQPAIMDLEQSAQVNPTGRLAIEALITCYRETKQYRKGLHLVDYRRKIWPPDTPPESTPDPLEPESGGRRDGPPPVQELIELSVDDVPLDPRRISVHATLRASAAPHRFRLVVAGDGRVARRLQRFWQPGLKIDRHQNEAVLNEVSAVVAHLRNNEDLPTDCVLYGVDDAAWDGHTLVLAGNCAEWGKRPAPSMLERLRDWFVRRGR